MPTTRSGCSQTGRDLRDRDARRVRGEDRVGGDDGLELREHLLLQLELLGHRLEHEVGALERRRRGRSRTGCEPPSSWARLEPVEHALPASSAPRLRPLERLGADVVQRGLDPGAGEHGRPSRGPSSPYRSPLRVSLLPRALLLQLLDAPPDALGRQRQLGHGNARVGERVHDRRGHGRQRAFAAALRAVRAGPVAVLDDHARHLAGQVLEARHAVVEQRVVEEQAVLVDHLLEQRVADPLQRRALVLALDELGVDRPADVGRGRGPAHRDDAGVRVDLDLGGADADLPEDGSLRVRARSARRDLAAADQLAAREPEVPAHQLEMVVRRRSVRRAGDRARAARGCPPLRAGRRGPRSWSTGSLRSSGRTGVKRVSAPRTVTCSGSTPISSAAICANAVRGPWPISVVLTRTTTRPSASRRQIALETGCAPAASRPTETPRPTYGSFGSPQPTAGGHLLDVADEVGVERLSAGAHLLAGRAAGSRGAGRAGRGRRAGRPRRPATRRSTAGASRRRRGRSLPARGSCRRMRRPRGTPPTGRGRAPRRPPVATTRGPLSA